MKSVWIKNHSRNGRPVKYSRLERVENMNYQLKFIFLCKSVCYLVLAVGETVILALLLKKSISGLFGFSWVELGVAVGRRWRGEENEESDQVEKNEEKKKDWVLCTHARVRRKRSDGAMKRGMSLYCSLSCNLQECEPPALKKLCELAIKV